MLAIAVPVVVASIAMGGRTLSHSVAAAVLLTIAWSACVSLGFAANQATLATLGPRVAVVRGAALGLIVTTALGVWVDDMSVSVGVSLALAGSIVVLVGGWETFVARRLRPPTRLLVVGPRGSCVNIIRELATSDSRSFCLVGIVDDESGAGSGGPLVLGSTAEMQRIVETVRPDLVALAPGCNRPETFRQLLDCAAAGFRVLELAQFYEYAFGRVPVRDLTRAWFMSVLHHYQRSYSSFVKRTADVLGATVLFVLAVPIIPVLVLLVRCTRGPVILRQVRVGEHGRPFTMYKFRTMSADAERPGEAVWAVENDPRVTAVGRTMRRLRLDELPQIWNVFRGEMSIVGPRPERPEFIEELLESVPFWTRRHLVKPGITGWAQIRRGYTDDAGGSLEKLSYDLWYIRHRSLTVDLVICARTLATIFRGERVPRVSTAPDELDPIVTLLQYATPPQREVDGRLSLEAEAV